MAIQPRIIVLLGIDAFEGKISGKTLLQKRFYFLSKLLGLDLGYQAHYFGPYSEVVANSVGVLRSSGLIKEEFVQFGFAAPQGFEQRRYDYSLASDGEAAITYLKKNDPELWEKIYTAIKKIQSAGDLPYQDLSIAAKAHFILEQAGASLSPESIKGKAMEFNWKVTEPQINKAIEFLTNLGMI